jgi:hypothetical protein
VGYLSQEALDDLAKGRGELQPALRKLKAAYIGRTYANAQAYAQHGLCRRLSTMVHMADTVFELLPPDLDQILELVTVMAATACIQNFIMSAFGCLENLAWIWVLEKNVRGKGGAELGRYDIGLGKRYLRKSFSTGFNAFVDGNQEWLAKQKRSSGSKLWQICGAKNLSFHTWPRGCHLASAMSGSIPIVFVDLTAFFARVHRRIDCPLSRRPEPNANVAARLDTVDDADLAISALTVREIRKGIIKLRAKKLRSYSGRSSTAQPPTWSASVDRLSSIPSRA